MFFTLVKYVLEVYIVTAIDARQYTEMKDNVYKAYNTLYQLKGSNNNFQNISHKKQ